MSNAPTQSKAAEHTSHAQTAEPTPQAEWNACCTELRRIRTQIISILEPANKANDYDKKIIPNIQTKWREAGYSREEIYKHAAAHILIGSTPRISEVPYADFPGNLSLRELFEAEIKLLLANDTYGVLERLNKLLEQPES